MKSATTVAIEEYKKEIDSNKRNLVMFRVLAVFLIAIAMVSGILWGFSASNALLCMVGGIIWGIAVRWKVENHFYTRKLDNLRGRSYLQREGKHV